MNNMIETQQEQTRICERCKTREAKRLLGLAWVCSSCYKFLKFWGRITNERS